MSEKSIEQFLYCTKSKQYLRFSLPSTVRCSLAVRTCAPWVLHLANCAWTGWTRNWCWTKSPSGSTCPDRSRLKKLLYSKKHGGRSNASDDGVTESHSPMHSMLNTKPCWADLWVSWSGMLSKPTCPFRLRVRMAAGLPISSNWKHINTHTDEIILSSAWVSSDRVASTAAAADIATTGHRTTDGRQDETDGRQDETDVGRRVPLVCWLLRPSFRLRRRRRLRRRLLGWAGTEESFGNGGGTRRTLLSYRLNVDAATTPIRLQSMTFARARPQRCAAARSN